MTTTASFRPAIAADSRACFASMRSAIHDLKQRSGELPLDAPTPDLGQCWARVEGLFGHLAATCSQWWLAEDPDGRPLGYARSIERESTIELTEFFVAPADLLAALAQLENAAHAAGVQTLDLTVPYAAHTAIAHLLGRGLSPDAVAVVVSRRRPVGEARSLPAVQSLPVSVMHGPSVLLIGTDYVLRAKDYGIPVVIGPGGSRFVLKRVALQRARALAAVTSDKVANIEIVVGAHGCCEDVRTLLRAGRGEMTNETRSLLKPGVVRDVYRIGGTLLAAIALGFEAREAFLHDQTVYRVTHGGEIEPFTPAGVPV